MGKSSESTGKISNRNLTNTLIGIGIVVLFCLIIYFLMPPPPETRVVNRPPDPFADPKAGMAHIRKLAETYGNDFERLSNDDRLFLNSIAYGHGRELLAKTVRELKRKPSGSGPGSSQ